MTAENSKLLRRHIDEWRAIALGDRDTEALGVVDVLRALMVTRQQDHKAWKDLVRTARRTLDANGSESLKLLPHETWKRIADELKSSKERSPKALADRMAGLLAWLPNPEVLRKYPALERMRDDTAEYLKARRRMERAFEGTGSRDEEKLVKHGLAAALQVDVEILKNMFNARDQSVLRTAASKKTTAKSAAPPKPKRK